jgi:hypothetical protein
LGGRILKQAVWNRRYAGPTEYVKFNKLKEGMRIYFQVIDWDRGGAEVTLEGTITGLKKMGYVKKKSVKVYDEKIGTFYISPRHIVRILQPEEVCE